MGIPAIPANEAIRLAALHQCKILDTAPEETFDEITRLAANCCQTPIALVSLIDTDRQWVKSRIGLEITEVPRNLSLCAHAILQPEIFVVPDALADERFANNPLVVGEPFVRAYAGVPLTTSKGHTLGTLCVIDHVKHQFSVEQLENLQLLARQLVRQLELRENLIELERTIVARKTTRKTPQAFLGKVAIGFGLVLAVLIESSTISYGHLTALLQSITSVETQPATKENSEQGLQHGNELEKQQQQWLQQIQAYALKTQVTHFIGIAISVGIACLICYLTYREGRSRCQAEEALEQERDFISAILDTVGALVIVLDTEGKIVRFNRECEQVTGYSFAEVWRQHLWNVFLAPQEVSSVKSVFNALQAGHFPNHYRNFWLTKTGESRLIDWSNTALVNSKGEVEYVIGTGIDVTDRQKAEQAISQLAAIVESSDDAIVSTDLDGKVVSWNPGAEKIYGYSAEEAKGQKLIDLVTLETSLKEETIMSTDQLALTATPYKTQHQTKDRQQIDIFLTVSLLKDTDGNILGSSMIANDISELRAIERMKDEFVSIVSHELRTPLSSLRGALGLLSSSKLGSLSEKGQRMLEIAINNTDRLVCLINDILDLERLEARTFPFAKEVCNIADIVREVTGMMQPVLEKAGIELSVSTTSALLDADPKYLIQVLTNLLNNAIKFSTFSNTIWLTTEVRSQEQLDTKYWKHSPSVSPYLLIQVKDQGRGIPDDQLEAIFERFHQVDASDSRQKGGTGLGLAICRSIVEQHEGQIWAESSLGQGSTFFISLPIKKDTPAANLVNSSHGSTSPNSSTSSHESCKINHYSPNSFQNLKKLQRLEIGDEQRI